jgi:hypothetical protein
MWIFATRSRPENCQRFIEAWSETKASTPVYVRIDDCDSKLDEIINLKWPTEFNIVIGPREGLREAMQELFLKNPNEPWYGLLADDLVPRTLKWDEKLIAVAGNKNISYPNDLGGKPRLPTHPVVGGDLIRELGWFGFPVVNHLFVDSIYQYIGNQLNNLHRLDDVIVEHVHPFWKKTESDNIYLENRKRSANDREQFLQWIERDGPTVINKLKKKGF